MGRFDGPENTAVASRRCMRTSEDQSLVTEVWVSSISSIHSVWNATGSTDNAMGFTPPVGELVLELGGEAQLGGADRRKIRRVRKQHTPAIAQPLMKTDRPLAGFLKSSAMSPSFRLRWGSLGIWLTVHGPVCNEKN